MSIIKGIKNKKGGLEHLIDKIDLINSACKNTLAIVRQFDDKNNIINMTDIDNMTYNKKDGFLYLERIIEFKPNETKMIPLTIIPCDIINTISVTTQKNSQTNAIETFIIDINRKK